MEGKILVKDLLYTRDQIEKHIASLERLTRAMFSQGDAFNKILEDLKIDKVSSFDVNGAANYLRDYAKLIDHAINTAEADWPV